MKIDVMCPLKSFKIRNRKDPWITNEILEAIKDKDVLLKKAKKSKKEEDWDRAKIARNTVNRDVKNLKSEFIRENLEEHYNDSKSFGKIYKIYSPQKINRTSVNILLRTQMEILSLML